MIQELPAECVLPKPDQMLQSNQDEDRASHLLPKIWMGADAFL